MKKIVLLLHVLFISVFVYAQRDVYNINRSWDYIPGWEVAKDRSVTVNIPHTWNLDALSGKWDYYRGLGNYVKTMDFPIEWSGKRVYIRFKGVNQTADLYVNSKHIGQHKGGYTAFAYDITPHITPGTKNTIWVRVTNALDLDVMPLLGDFNFYGGIYRDVELVVVPDIHFSIDHYADSGVKIRTTDVSEGSAELSATAKIDSLTQGQASVNFTLYDAAGVQVASQSKPVRIAKTGISDVSAIFDIANPHLWNSVEDPYLYRLEVTVGEKNGVTYDSISQSVGFRYFSVDAENQFILNGKPFRVQGVGRHQDWAMLGNAIFPENHRRDVELMLDMGVNAVRLTHYPHDPYFIELCDKAGIMVWSEIPFVGPGGYRDKGFNDSEEFKANGERQLLEMLNQLGNHPSIIWWGIFNELTQRGDDPVNYVRHLNEIIKREDPTRFTVAASNQDGELNFITDLIAFNHYFGWYGGEPVDVRTWAASLKERFPDLKFGLSEYGAGGSVYQHSDSLVKTVPTSYWHPEQWQTYFHEVHWSVINEGYCWGTFVWAMFDFGAAHRTEGQRPGINDKGLVTFDRLIKKDAYYFYKANWNSKDKFVYIAERRWQNRPQTVQNIKVYSNVAEVELFVDGISYGIKQSNGLGTFLWNDIPMSAGEHNIEARGVSSDCSDRCAVSVRPVKLSVQ